MESLSVENAFEEIGFGKFQCLLVSLCGIIQSFDALEMLLLAYIQPILRCVWQVTLLEESWLITGGFIGMMLGGPIFGRLCDLYGRKSILIMCSFSLAYMGLLCSASPSVLWIIILRTFIGAFLGGIVSSLSTLASELMPMANRGSALIIILAFYSLGSYIIVILCVTIVPALGWRYFLAISTFPIILTLPFLQWLPESPRFLLLNETKQEALDIINRIADTNKKAKMKDIIQSQNLKHSIWDIFHTNYLSTTVLVSFMWFVAGLSYYAIILIVTKIDSVPHQCYRNMNLRQFLPFTKNSTSDDSCCLMISWDNSRDTIISTTGELTFLPLSIILINVVGRKHSMALFALIITISFIIMNFCISPLFLSLLLFITRGSINSSFNITYIYTSEVFPTSVRSVAIGLCTTSSRLGAIMSPFIVNFILMEYSFLCGTIILMFLNFLTFIAILLLPYETKNRQLYQTAEECIINEKKVEKRR